MTEGTAGTIGREHGDTDSAGAGSGPPTPPPTGGSEPQPPIHRRRWFLPLLVVTFCLLGGFLFLTTVDWDAAERSLSDQLFADTYRADLTEGHGDFTVFEDETSASSYAPDGYHLVGKPDQPAMRAIQAAGSHTALGVRLSARATGAPSEFVFGPACWHSMDEAYVLFVSSTGEVALAETDLRKGTTSSVLRDRTIDPIDWSTWHTLRIDCALGAATMAGRHATATLTGYVDGRRVLHATSSHRADVLAYTGFMGGSLGTQPTEWVVRSFERLGPDALAR